MKTFQSTKVAALIPTALAVLLSTLAQVMYGDERQAEDAFRSFSLRFNQNQYGAARTDVERAIALSPENAYSAAGKGLLIFRMSQRQFDPAGFLKMRLTLSEEESKSIADAAQQYRRALALNPLDDNNYHNLGWLYALQQQREQSLSCFQQAAALDGSVAIYHLSLGLVYEQGGEDEAAYRVYERAVRLSPAVLDSPFFRDLSVRAPEAADRIIRNSISHFEERARRTPDPIVQGKLGLLYLRANRPDEAAAALPEGGFSGRERLCGVGETG
jgi:tetratricopeptide (TPR) repeat protein